MITAIRHREVPTICVSERAKLVVVVLSLEGVERYFPMKGNFEALHHMTIDRAIYSLELEGEWIRVNNVKRLEIARRTSLTLQV